jgi:menaquinone-dependent protoporphyrinogen oxidase
MSAPVLVAYATKNGSTREVAEAVATTLREHGCEVEVQPAGEVRTLEKYGAVVLGTAVYMFRWRKDARRFMSRHQAALAERPVAVFALGPLNDNEKEWADVHKQFEEALAKYPWLSPVAHEVFGGKFDPARLTFPLSLMPAMKNQPASDIRDWAAIAAWAVGLAQKLQASTG